MTRRVSVTKCWGQPHLSPHLSNNKCLILTLKNKKTFNIRTHRTMEQAQKRTVWDKNQLMQRKTCLEENIQHKLVALKDTFGVCFYFDLFLHVVVVPVNKHALYLPAGPVPVVPTGPTLVVATGLAVVSGIVVVACIVVVTGIVAGLAFGQGCCGGLGQEVNE